MQVPGIATVSHHARVATKLAPGRPALWLGLRAAAATALPLAFAPWLDPIAATWAPLAGYGIALVDKGGAYRSRAKAMASVAVGGLVAVTLGTLVGSHPVLSVALVTIAATLCAFGQAFPPAGPAVGNTIALHLIVATFLPTSPHSLFPALAGYAAGAAWALFLGLVVWPVRVYKPLRRAVSAALTALADYTTALSVRAYRDELTNAHRAIRDRLELARRTLVSTGAVVAPSGPRRAPARDRPCGRPHVRRARRHRRGTRCWIARRGYGRAVAGPRRACRGASRDRGGRCSTSTRGRCLPPAFDPALEIRGEDAATQHARLLLERATPSAPLCGPRRLARDRERTGDRRRRRARYATLVSRRVAREPRSRLGGPASRAARCDLRAVASTIASLYALNHGYWIALTTYLLLQPNRSATTTRAVQRGVGTVIGAVVRGGDRVGHPRSAPAHDRHRRARRTERLGRPAQLRAVLAVRHPDVRAARRGPHA